MADYLYNTPNASVLNSGYSRSRNTVLQPGNMAGGNLAGVLDVQALRVLKAYATVSNSTGSPSAVVYSCADNQPLRLGPNEVVLNATIQSGTGFNGNAITTTVSLYNGAPVQVNGVTTAVTNSTLLAGPSGNLPHTGALTPVAYYMAGTVANAGSILNGTNNYVGLNTNGSSALTSGTVGQVYLSIQTLNPGMALQ